MTLQLSEFLGGYQRGIEVAVAGATPDELLGVREAFRRYFRDRLERPVAVAVVPQEFERRLRGIAESDAAAIGFAAEAARALAERFGATYQFYVGLEACIQALAGPGSATGLFLRSWSVVVGPPGEARGASGSLELPAHLIHGLPRRDVPAALPATRKSGGLMATLTGGLETRRSAVSLATLNALSSLFFGILESHPGLRR